MNEPLNLSSVNKISVESGWLPIPTGSDRAEWVKWIEYWRHYWGDDQRMNAHLADGICLAIEGQKSDDKAT